MKSSHGGINQYNLDRSEDYLDLSVNINPYGPSGTLNLRPGDIASYPDPYSRALCKILADQRAVPIDSLLVGNGATELLWASARAFLGPDDRALVIQPGFSEFSSAVNQLGRGLAEFMLKERNDFHLSPEELDHRLAQHRPRVLYLCNPNSPTGGYLEPSVINCLALLHPGCLILLDESFLSLSLHHQKADAVYERNVVRIVSLTKDHAIAGLRLGYCFGAEGLIQKIRAEIPPWNVNVFAQKLGERLFDDKKFVERSRDFIFRDKAWLEAELDLRRIRRLPSSTVFLMFQDDCPGLQQILLRDHHVLIRCCESYGFPDWYRIAVRPRTDMQRFLAAYDHIKSKGLL